MGGKVLAGVYLVRMDLAADCTRAARSLGFPVPCPTLVPNSGTMSGPPRCGERTSYGALTRPPCVFGRAFLFDQPGFAVPPFYAAGAVQPHLTIVAFDPDDPEVDPATAYLLGCPEGDVLGMTAVARPAEATLAPTELIDCSDGPPPHGGHVLVRWSVETFVFAASLHGNTQTNRDLLHEIAAGLLLVAPR
jgi:hypothetical protein